MEQKNDDILECYPKFTQFQKDLLRSLKKKDIQLAQKLILSEEKENPIKFEEIIYNCFYYHYCWLKDEVKPLADLVELFLDCGAKIDYMEAMEPNFPYDESLFHCAVCLSRAHQTHLTRLMLEYGADPNVYPCNGRPCVGLPALDRKLDVILLLMQFGSAEEFDIHAIECWNYGKSDDVEMSYVTKTIETERKSLNNVGEIQKVRKVPTFSLWPEEERIKKLKTQGWSSEKITELFELEKINGSVVKNFVNSVPQKCNESIFYKRKLNNKKKN